MRPDGAPGVIITTNIVNCEVDAVRPEDKVRVLFDEQEGRALPLAAGPITVRVWWMATPGARPEPLKSAVAWKYPSDCRSASDGSRSSAAEIRSGDR